MGCARVGAMKGVRAGLIGMCLMGGALALAPAAGAATFSNPEAIQTAYVDSGPLSPYPSQIFVQGQQGTVVKSTVTLTGVAHEYVGELRGILLAPGGQYAMFMRDACGSQDTRTGPLTFSFDDAAGSSLPNTPTCTSGTYRPTDFSPNSTFDYSYPAPPHPYPHTLAGMAGANPNGPWKLFVWDGASGNPGTINGGWSLDLTTTGAPAIKPKKKCKKKHKRSASAAKKRCKKKRR